MRGRDVYDNPSVVLVVLEIRHPTAEPLSRSAQIRIKQALSKDFPLHRIATLATIQGTVGGQSDVNYEKAPKYLSRDLTLSVTFKSEALVIETTRYIGYQWLRRLAGLVFRVRQEVAPIDGVERIGLRYVNEIRVPEVGLRLSEWSEWVDPSLLGPAPIAEKLGLDTGPMQSVLLMRTAVDRSIILRYGLREGYALDPGGDLRRPTPTPGPFFLLDIDSSWTPAGEIPEPDPNTLPELCDELHGPIRQLFERFISDRFRTEVLNNAGQSFPSKSIRGNAAGRGTAGEEIVNPPEVDSTRTSSATLLTDDIGFGRSRARFLNQDFDELHHQSHFFELGRRTAERARSSIGSMLSDLADLGFAWRDIARLVGVSVPAIQKWRRGERASGESRQRVAYVLATCDLIEEHYEVQEIASWFETPLVSEVPLTPMDLYIGERVDLVFDYASGHIADPEQVLNAFDAGWRERYRSDFETFQADDGQLSIRPKAH